jgi:two-component system alkaline phosphatase synthesis response regulator PhoP
MGKPLIYAVDDEASIRKLYEAALPIGDFEAKTLPGGPELFLALREKKPALILLDIMLEGEDGFAILGDLKKDRDYQNIPVIVVSAKGEELDKVKGLNSGASDYLAKPFGVLELIARINANLRKGHPAVSDKIVYKELAIDEESHTATLKGQPLPLSKKEYELLKTFASAPEKALTKERLLSLVWGINEELETRTLDIHVLHLRKKLAGSSLSIATIRGVGYILK